MEVRRRVAETVQPAEGAASAAKRSSDREGAATYESTTSPLVQEGLKLYAEAEKSGFREVATLQKSLQYFLQAAEEGENDATEWIGSFLDSMSALPSSVVLPPSILSLMHWVREATDEEKEVSRIADTMFLTMARGRECIPEAEFDTAVQTLLAARSDPEMLKSSKDSIKYFTDLKISVKKLLCSAAENCPSREVSREMFREAAVTYAQGKIPHEGGELTQQQLKEFSSANLLKKTLNYPVQTLHFVKRSLLKMIERRGVKWIWSSFPTKQFYLLLAAYFLPMMSLHFILSTTATALFFAAFIAMSIATLQIILNAEKIFSFTEYFTVFQYFNKQGKKIDVRKPESLLIKRSVFPYLTFSVSLCVALVTLKLSHQQLIISEAVCLFSALVTGIVFFQFQCYKSSLFLITASSRVMGWFYVFLVLCQDVIPIPKFLLYTGTAFVSIPLFPRVAIEISMLTVVQLPLQLALISYFLYLNKWHNFYSGLGPYLLFVSWMVLCRYFFTRSSPMLLFVALFGILLFFVLVPFLPLLFLGSPLFFLCFYGLSREFFISLSLVLVFSLLFLFIGKYLGKLMETRFLNIPVDYLVLIQILISIPAILMGASWFSSLYSPQSLPTVSLSQYSEYCGPQNWAENNMVQAQLDCLHLRNRILSASGTVVAVRIDQITNSKELSLSSMPTSVTTVLTCLFGQSEPMCGQKPDMETCRKEYTGCHFHYSNKYTFAIAMTVALPPYNDIPSKNISATLLMISSSQTMMSNITAGKLLEFNGTFVSGMGSDKLTLRLVNLEGIMEKEEDVEEEIQLFGSQLISSVRNTFAFLFDVLIGYSSV